MPLSVDKESKKVSSHCRGYIRSMTGNLRVYFIQHNFNSSSTCLFHHILGDPGAVSRGRAKWRDESFQERAEEPQGTKSHRTISKRLREYRLLIGQKKSLVLFCPIGEQQLSNHFRVFLHGDRRPSGSTKFELEKLIKKNSASTVVKDVRQRENGLL